MPKTKGHIDEIEKINNDGNTFLVLTIDGTEYYLHDNDKFGAANEGDDVRIDFTENQKGDKTYRNINEIHPIGASSEETSDRLAEWRKKAKALELSILYKEKIGTEDSVSEMADKFVDYMSS